MSLFSEAADFAAKGVQDDVEKFESYGVDPMSVEATPFYARWIREDLIATYFVVSKSAVRIEVALQIAVLLLVLIAIPLWIIALR